MATYRVVPGSFSIAPVQSAYAAGEDVQLHIMCQLQRKDGAGSLLTWQSRYQIYKKNGQLLKTVLRTHSELPWTDVDSASDDFIESLGPFSEGLLEGNVIVSASG